MKGGERCPSYRSRDNSPLGCFNGVPEMLFRSVHASRAIGHPLKPPSRFTNASMVMENMGGREHAQQLPKSRLNIHHTLVCSGLPVFSPGRAVPRSSAPMKRCRVLAHLFLFWFRIAVRETAPASRPFFQRNPRRTARRHPFDRNQSRAIYRTENLPAFRSPPLPHYPTPAIQRAAPHKSYR